MEMIRIQSYCCLVCLEHQNEPEDAICVVLKMHLCGHRVCHECLKKWFSACEVAGRILPTCPGCRERFDEDEAADILGREYTPAGTTEQALDSDDTDEFTMAYLAEQGAKECTNCGAWIIREDGCDAMQCLCGYRFCWYCEKGCDECGCGHDEFYDNLLDCEMHGEDYEVANADEILDLRTFLERWRMERQRDQDEIEQTETIQQNDPSIQEPELVETVREV
jgi:hypothetical protein